MTAERKIAYMAAILNIWAPLLADGHVTVDEFKKEILGAVEFQENLIKTLEAA